MNCNKKDGEIRGDDKLRSMVEDPVLLRQLSRIDHKILVLSGKGGVGKSTVAVNLALALAREGYRTGLLDVDFHGPSVPRLLNMTGWLRQAAQGDGIEPLESHYGMKVVSLGLALGRPDEAVIWRGPMKMGVIKQLLTEVKWGDLDYLIVDFPPGTGDEPLSVAQLIPDSDGALIVTTPQDISLQDVRKSINFCRQLGINVLGVIENMSGLTCPHCGGSVDVFKKGGGEAMAKEMEVPFLGRIPLDPQVVEASDAGRPFAEYGRETQAGRAFLAAVQPFLLSKKEVAAGEQEQNDMTSEKEVRGGVKIAVPTAAGRLCPHFGHCEEFSLFEVDPQKAEIRNVQSVTAPPHEPGLLPSWLSEKGVGVIIAGGMGSRAQELFSEKGIKVVVGAPQEEPVRVVEDYLRGVLRTGANSCDH